MKFIIFEFDTTLCFISRWLFSQVVFFISFLSDIRYRQFIFSSSKDFHMVWRKEVVVVVCSPHVHQALCVIFFAFKPSYHQVAFNPFCKRDFHYLHIKRPTYLKQQKKRIGALSNFIQKKSLPFQKRMENMQLKFSSSNK